MPQHDVPPAAVAFTVLFIEHDERLVRLTTAYLQAQGVAVVHARDGTAGLAAVRTQSPDVVLLNLLLPGSDGLEVCRQIRAITAAPIVMLTDPANEVDRVVALELGADDCLTIPFSLPELHARMRAKLRRTCGRSLPGSGSEVRVGRLTFDRGARKVTLDGTRLDLTSSEFTVLDTLAERAGRTLGRDQLLDIISGASAEVSSRSIDLHVARLRRKLGDRGREPRLLKTVWGQGYVLTNSEA